MDIISIFFVFIFGISVGSFLNVCIYRFQNNLSIIKPDSFCPKCQAEIRWYDNIPILSYIFLKGKCRNCKAHISLQYPLIEFFTGLLTIIFFLRWNDNIFWLFTILIVSYLLIILSVIDFKTMMISDFFSYTIGLLGVISSLINPYFNGDWHQRLVLSLRGIIGGFVLFFLLSYIGKIIYKKDAIGEGDIFLIASMGSFFGIKGIISILVIASFLGSLYGITLILLKKSHRLSYMPFGPFLSLACIFDLYSYWDFVKFISS